MLVENQLVEIRWSGNNKKWFESKGYEYTKLGDTFMCKVDDLMKSSKVKVEVKCDYCDTRFKKNYKDYQRGLKRINKVCCDNQECKNKKTNDVYRKKIREDQFDKFIKLCNERNFTPLSTIDDYQNAHSKLKYLCHKHGLKETIFWNFLHNEIGCDECSYELIADSKRYSTEKVIHIIEEKNGNKLLNPNDYLNMYTNNLEILCGSCDSIYTTSLSAYVLSSGMCRLCANKSISENRKLNEDELIKRIESKNNNILLNPNDYMNVYEKNLHIICGSCKKEFVSSLNTIDIGSGRCPKCTKKKGEGEYIIEKFLIENNLSYIWQHKFDDCRDILPLPFDFYLPDYNMCIEFDGQHHYEPAWGEERFKKTLLHDGMKNNYCRWNNIKLLRIPYWDGNNIEDILVKELNLKPKHNKIVYIPTAQRKQNKTA